MVTTHRQNEFTVVRDRVRAWAGAEDAIVAVGLVGSWARDEPRMDSDIDVVVLTTDTGRFTDHEDWTAKVFGIDADADIVRTAKWGLLTERRVRLGSGLEIEFGFVDPSWAAVAPVDPGTQRVVTDGCLAWYDPPGLFSSLLQAVER